MTTKKTKIKNETKKVVQKKEGKKIIKDTTSTKVAPAEQKTKKANNKNTEIKKPDKKTTKEVTKETVKKVTKEVKTAKAKITKPPVLNNKKIFGKFQKRQSSDLKFITWFLVWYFGSSILLLLSLHSYYMGFGK